MPATLQHDHGELHPDFTNPETIRTTMQQTCTIGEAMALVEVSRRTIYNWMAKGKVRWVRVAGGQPRIVKRSLFRSEP
jgi:excisionase family DNA binding protein